MRTYIRHNPHRLWQGLIALAPLWSVAAIAGWSWTIGQPLPETVQPASGTVQAPPTQVLADLGPLNRYRAVWGRPLRQRLVEPPVPPKPVPQPQERAVPYTLIGTAVEGVRSYALLRDRQGGIVVAELGKRLESFVVHAIEPDRVGLRRDGNMTYLLLPEDLRRQLPESARHRGVRQVTSRSDTARQDAEATEAELTQARNASQASESAPSLRLSRLSSEQFMKDTRLMPVSNGRGGQLGFRLDSIARSSHVHAAGLRAGDVIVAIDGQDLAQLTDMGRIHASLDDQQDHEWQVLRDQTLVRVEIIPSKEFEDESR